MNKKNEIQEHILSCIPKTDKYGHSAQGRLHLAPRLGKTKIIIDLIKRDKPESILWITPSSQLAKVDIPAEFIKWGAKEYLPCLTAKTWSSLKNQTGYYDLIVLDEEQKITAKNVVVFRDGSLGGRIISMTGTPTANEEKELLLRNLDLPILFVFDTEQAIKFGVLSDYNIDIHMLDMSLTKDIQAGNKSNRFMTSEFLQYKYLEKLYENNKSKGSFVRRQDSNGNWATYRTSGIGRDMLNLMKATKNSQVKIDYAKELIQNIAKNSDSNTKTIVFTPNIEICDSLCDKTFHSKTDDKDLNWFLEEECEFFGMKDKVLGLVNTGGIGFTFENLTNIIIMSSDSDKNGTTSQKIARGLLSNGIDVQVDVLVLDETKDVAWTEKMLERFDEDKINIKSNRYYIEVDFSEKEEVKKLGASWDMRVEKWYIPNNLNKKDFSQWLSDEELYLDLYDGIF